MSNRPATHFVLERIRRAGLEEIHDLLESSTRLNFEQGMRLATCPDLVAVGLLANRVRERLHGDICFFNRNLHINATNVCEATCIFCSFSRLKTGDPQSWTLSIQQAVERVRALDSALISEVHIVNGLNPDLPFSYYIDLLKALKAVRPELHIKGFTAVEIAYYAQKYDMSLDAVLEAMTEAGLDSMPGGGAEIFAPRARRKLCHDKVDGDGWLEIHRIAHRKGIRTNATMLFGSIETLEERVDHLCQLRGLQDRSLQDGATDPDHAGGHFQTFIPLRFHNDNNRLERLASPTGFDSLRTIALSRLMLDNFPHIKAYWPMLGTQIAQVGLHFGASDLDGTVREEHIYHMAGASTPQGHTPEELCEIIHKAQRCPVERDTLYHVIRRLDPAQALTPTPQTATRARVGIVGYKNSLPLTKYLSAENLELRYGHPSDVAQWLQEGEVDLALLPVAALFNDQVEGFPEPAFRVIPDLAIGCDGPVDSVLLAAETPPEAWTHVLLDGASRTSVCLARLLLCQGPLSKRVRPDLQFIETEPGGGVERAQGTHATVVIGDLALDLPERLCHRLDMGEAWKDWTGLPFVFALWTGRASLDLELVEQVRSAGLKGLQELREGTLDGTLNAATRDYLQNRIHYSLNDQSTMGLMRFASMARRAGLLASEHFSLYPPAPWSRQVLFESTLALQDLLLGEIELEDLCQLAEQAPLSELMAAAGLENAPERSVSYQARNSESMSTPSMVSIGNLGGMKLGTSGVEGEAKSFDAWLTEITKLPSLDLYIQPGPETRPTHWAQLLIGLRESTGPYIRALWIQDPGPDGGPETTGTEWLRIVALARLTCPQIPHILVETQTHGAGLSQLALHSGATDLGMEGEGSEVHGSALERHIRMAGFEPVRRSAQWELLGRALSQEEDLKRPLRRLDSPTGG